MLFVVGLLMLLGAYFFLRSSRHLEWHAYIGTSLEPVASLLSLVAVVGALWSVHVQRRDLALQRQELRENRDEMKEQRAQFERTATAQETLIKAQSLAAMSTARLGMTLAMIKELEMDLVRNEAGTFRPDHKANVENALNANLAALQALNNMAGDLLTAIEKE